MNDTSTTSTTASVDDLLTLVTRIAEQARPGEELEVYASRGVETDVRAYDGQIEQLSSASSAGVGIRVVSAQRQGFAYAGTLDEAAIAETLAEARDNATFATPDEHLGLARPDAVAPASLDLWDDALSALPTSAKVEMALELERRVRGGDPRVRQVDAADYGDMAAEAAIATSTGITATARRTICSLSVSAIAGDGADSQTGVGFSAGRGPGDVDSELAATDAIERATRMIGASKVKSGRCVVVLDSRVTSTLLSVISSALSGEAVTKGRSIFAGRIGEEVACPLVTLVDDPTDARAFGASTHDAEGLACRRNVLIDAGTLRGFVFDTTAARRAGTASTASAVRGGYATTPTAGCRALLLAPGSLDAAGDPGPGGGGVLRPVGDRRAFGGQSGERGLLRGGRGLMIRGGVLAEPVREGTIASTLQRMLQEIVHVGRDVEWLPGLAAGQTLAVDGMVLSGA